MDDIYPLTIVSDRYSGVYSDGQYLAFNLYPSDIPREIGGCDTDEMIFWSEYENGKCQHKIGRGDTPTDAMNNLRSLILA